MGLIDYFAGKHFRLYSPLPRQVVVERLNGAASWTAMPVSNNIVGGMLWGRLRVRYRRSLFEYNMKPVLSGRIEASSTGSILYLRYGAPIFAYIFYGFWYFFALSMVMTFFEGDKVTMSAGNNATIFALFFLSPIGGHAFGTRHADEELESLIEFVARNAQTAL